MFGLDRFHMLYGLSGLRCFICIKACLVFICIMACLFYAVFLHINACLIYTAFICIMDCHSCCSIYKRMSGLRWFNFHYDMLNLLCNDIGWNMSGICCFHVCPSGLRCAYIHENMSTLRCFFMHYDLFGLRYCFNYRSTSFHMHFGLSWLSCISMHCSLYDLRCLYTLSHMALYQKGQLSVSGERMCTILGNRLED